MSNFIARIVLHKSTDESNYDLLHEDMEGIGYLRQITGDSGKTWKMPPAMYVRYTEADIENEREAIATVVRRHWKKRFAIFLSTAPVAAWRGLDEIDEE